MSMIFKPFREALIKVLETTDTEEELRVEVKRMLEQKTKEAYLVRPVKKVEKVLH